ncbi:hypothetical protein CTA1_12378 [Colletotrichum tanaceti]|uniref:Uncharacterized protein n=1 Tax=Colletotrichum tanaceti TaxID=1306861 RepID=A0A4U6XM50_9PEZI|nr:hypothetical protein CTA1_12378 [Colletotrichum tanaceti]
METLSNPTLEQRLLDGKPPFIMQMKYNILMTTSSWKGARQHLAEERSLILQSAYCVGGGAGINQPNTKLLSRKAVAADAM